MLWKREKFCPTGNQTWAVQAIASCYTNSAIPNKVLRRIFGLNGDDIIGGWRKLHNEELHNLYSLSNIIRMIRSRQGM
jgi:hypothetical protein